MEPLNLSFHRTFLSLSQSHLVIDGNHIEYRNKSLNFNEITAIEYGVLQMIINGIPANRIFHVGLKTADPKRKIVIGLQAFGLRKKWYAKKEALYFNIVAHLWPVTRRLANEALQHLQKKETVTLAGIKLNHEGIWLPRGIFKKTYAMVPWKECGKIVHRGSLILNSTTDRKRKITLTFLRTPNSVVLDILLSHLWDKGKVLKLSRGEKIETLA